MSVGSSTSNDLDENVTNKSTGKPLSEALIFASTNPQYDDRLFIKSVWLLRRQIWIKCFV